MEMKDTTRMREEAAVDGSAVQEELSVVLNSPIQSGAC